MSSILRFGVEATVDIDVAPSALVADCSTVRGEPLADPVAATVAALAQTLDFPPLRQAVVPGDRVALALEAEVPQASALVAAIVSVLLDAGVSAGDISIVRPLADRATAKALRSNLPAEVRDAIEIVDHDPAQRDRLSYLAADHDSNPIYIDRRLFDADVVLPIGCIRFPSTPGYFGINSTLYPTFSDAPTIERFRATDVAPSPEEIARRRREADEMAWLLGAVLTIQVVPAAGGGLLHVLAGNAVSVERRGGALCQAAWEYEIPQRAELVVAAIEGGDDQQTWENVGRAIAAASRAVADDGAIALCAELATEPGPALVCLARARDLPDALRRIRKQHSSDAAVAHELVEALQRGRVYLLSRLEESVVEDLGMAPVGGPADIARLVHRHGSCILLGNAQYAQPTSPRRIPEQVR